MIRPTLKYFLRLAMRPLNFTRLLRIKIETGLALSMVQSIQILHGAKSRKSSFYFSPLLDPDNFTKFLQQRSRYSANLKKNVFIKRINRRESKNGAESFEVNSNINSNSKLLIISDNWNFLQSAIEGMEAIYGIHVRTFDYSLLRKSKFYSFNSSMLPKSRWFYSSKLAQLAIDDTLILRELLDSCDSILVEWGSEPARFFSHHIPVEKRLVVRVHSYEAFTPLSYFLNFSRINQLIFVAPHIKNLMELLHETRIRNIPSCIVPNVRELKVSTKSSELSHTFTIGMAGYSNLNKNPILALEIIKRLRDDGLSIHLRFCGHPWLTDGLKPDEKLYRDRFYSYLRDNKLEELVKFDPFVDEMSEWLMKVDFILSCSFREGTHEVIVEGAALGCVPIIRDWPMVKELGGARAVFSDFNDLIFDEAEEAVSLIKSILPDFYSVSQKSGAIAAANFGLLSTLPEFVKGCFPGMKLDV